MSASPTRKSRVRWAVGALVAFVVGLNVVALALDRVTSSPGGPSSSSYATAPEGAAAYADLLRRSGRLVERLREAPAEAELDPAATVVLLDPTAVSRADARALRSFVERGGTLVAGGARPERWLRRLLAEPPKWSRAGPTDAVPVAPVPEAGGVRTVRTAGEGSWAETGEALPVLVGGGRTTLAVATPGRGRIALLADASPLQNRLLAAADNAAFGVALAGERGARVVFVESVHGYGGATGIRAIPTSWRWTLGGLAIAALTLMLARGRRLGPPEREARVFPPARREYVESLAGVLARTKRPGEAVAPVRAAARARLARRAGLGPDPGPVELERAGERLGLPPDELRAVVDGAGDQGELLTAGRPVARPGGRPDRRGSP